MEYNINSINIWQSKLKRRITLLFFIYKVGHKSVRSPLDVEMDQSQSLALYPFLIMARLVAKG